MRTSLERKIRLLKWFVAVGVLVSMASRAFTQADSNGQSFLNHAAKKLKLNASLSVSAMRGFDEFSEESAYYQGVIGMKINENLKTDMSIGYSHPFDFDANRTDRWEIEDVLFRLLKSSIWKNDSKSQNISLTGSISLPTSGTSKDSSLYSQISLTTGYTLNYKKLTFVATPTIVGALHKFDTADEEGFEKNSPLGISLGGSIRYGVTSKLGLALGASIYSMFNYDFNNKNIQTVSGAVEYLVNKKISLSFSGRWRSKVVTNNSLFDDDASFVSLGLVYNI